MKKIIFIEFDNDQFLFDGGFFSRIILYPGRLFTQHTKL